MDQKQLLKIIDWSKKHHKTLESLYNDFKADTGDTETSFIEFCAAMYFNCKH